MLPALVSNLLMGRENSELPQCALGGVQWMECSPSASFTVINGDGDNRSFIRRSVAVCVSAGSRSYSHTEDPFSL